MLETKKSTPLGDVRYNAAHKGRNQARVKAVIKNCPPVNTILDIGCNAGYFSRALLDGGFAQRVDAIEYDQEIVPEDLKLNPRFSLYPGDVANFSFESQYDVTIYGAVHHHFFALHGYERAMMLWLDIVSHTNKVIFFESGQLPEGCRWYWQRALRNYYSSDENYIADLLYSIGARLKEVRLIGCYWIHAVPRWLLKIELRPKGEIFRLPRHGPQVQVNYFFKRTIGSKDQSLISAGAFHHRVHDGVSFQVGVTEERRKVFCKKYLADRKEDQEFEILEQINDPRFVKPIGLTDENGLIFPFIDSPTLATVQPGSVKDVFTLRKNVLSLFNFASDKVVFVEFENRRQLSLIDIIDLHASNMFYDDDESSILVFDLELYSLSNRHRNRMNLIKILYRFGKLDIYTLGVIAINLCKYLVDLFIFSIQSPERRVLERTVSVPRWLYMHLREKIDKFIFYFIPRYRQ